MSERLTESDSALADALVDAAESYANGDEDADVSIIEAEGPIIERLDISLDETEQGLTQSASDRIYGFAREHTSKPELAARVFGDEQSDYMVTVKGFGHVSTAKYRATSIDEAMRKARHAKGIHVEARKIVEVAR